MHCHFCRRQREDQPSMASVHGRKSEDVPQEGAVSRRMFTVHNHMRTKDHKVCPLPPSIRDKGAIRKSNLKNLKDSEVSMGKLQRVVSQIETSRINLKVN